MRIDSEVADDATRGEQQDDAEGHAEQRVYGQKTGEIDHRDGDDDQKAAAAIEPE
jgi:hypothetical protein